MPRLNHYLIMWMRSACLFSSCSSICSKFRSRKPMWLKRNLF
uniref:Uncharacterized protein n=1 Tax=Arundo donax TaxID=35708 RepID=A0A0A8YB63_ARUDO